MAKRTRRSAPRVEAKSIQNRPDPLAQAAWPSSARSSEEEVERQQYERIWRAFQLGDFARCRAEARILAQDARTEEVKLRALALVNRLRPDPLAIGVAAGALLLLVVALIIGYA